MSNSLEIVCKKCGKKLATVEMKIQGETVVIKGRTDSESVAGSDGVYWNFRCTDKRCELSSKENENGAIYKVGTLKNNLKLKVI